MTEFGWTRHGVGDLGAQFEELAGLLTARSGPPDPDRVVTFAARAVPNGEHCGLTLTRRSGRPATVARSGPLVDLVDQIQYETAQGPCLQAVGGRELARADDLETDQQWPLFARRCVAETGVRSMFSVRLFLSGDDRAALNFYAHEPDVLDDLDIGAGAVVAPFVAMAIQNVLQAREVGHLQTALHSSRQIGTAVGILMARNLLTSEEAFALLVRASQQVNRKLRDIAAEVEETGVLPELIPRRRPRSERGRR